MITLILSLLLSVVALELLRWKIQVMGGLDLRKTIAVNALRYVPTVVVILLAFAWKNMSSDFSLIMPWVAMSGKWADASDSILLNYIDSLDIVSVYTALRHRHWALASVVSCGILHGAMVPLANTLSERSLSANRKHHVSLSVADDFHFNGSLAIPISWRSVQPWLQWREFATEQNESAHFPWLTTWRAYQSLDITGYEGTLIEADVKTFSASLDCEPIQYLGTYYQAGWNSSFVLEAQEDTGCSLPISQTIIWPYNSSSITQYPVNNETETYELLPFMWSNVSNCNAQDDLRLLFTSMALNISADQVAAGVGNNTTSNNEEYAWQDGSIAIDATGLVCSPKYWSTVTTVTVNGTTGLPFLSAVLRQSAAEPIKDVGVDLDILHALMNNPSDVYSQIVFKAAATNDWSPFDYPNSYDWSEFSSLQVMQRYGYLYLYEAAVYDPKTPPMDPFFTALTYGGVSTSDLQGNSTSFRDTIDKGFTHMMATAVSNAARGPGNTSIPCTVTVELDLMLIRNSVLRALQAVLAFLAMVALAITIFAMPYSLLDQDPSSLDQISRLIANSPDVDAILTGLGSYSNAMLERILENTRCRLIRGNKNLRLELFQISHAESRASDTALQGQETEGQRASRTSRKERPWNPLQHIYSSSVHDDQYSARYRPLGLRLGSRVTILVVCITVVAVAICLLYFSDRYNGFRPKSSTAAAAFDLVPSLVLVILGYSIASMAHASLTLATYSQITAASSRSGLAMIRGRANYANHFLTKQYISNLAQVLIPCFVLVTTFPVLKILSGNLYDQSIIGVSIPTTFPIDISAMRQLNELSQWANASGGTNWLDGPKMTLSQTYAGTAAPLTTFDKLGSLNFPVVSYNITSLLNSGPQSTERDQLDVTMVALNTSVSCSAADDEDFALFATACNETAGYEFQFRCASSNCERDFGLPLSKINVSTTILPLLNNGSAEQPPYFSSSFPSKSDDSMTIILANFSALSGPSFNYSRLSCDGKPVDLALFGGMETPKIRAVNCTRAISLVRANVSFSRLDTGSDPYTLAGKQNQGDASLLIKDLNLRLQSQNQQIDWYPSAYDPRSIEFIDNVMPRSSRPATLLVPDQGGATYHEGHEFNPKLVPYLFLSFLTQRQEVVSGSQFDLMHDRETLISATQDVYQDYSQLAISNALGDIDANWLVGTIPVDHRPSPELVNVTDASFILYRQVVKQDLGFTLSFIILVTLVICCVVCLSWVMPRSTLLPKAPSSIAAQLSILAGSRLVSILRSEGAPSPNPASTSEFFTKNRFGIGWWPVEDPTYDQPLRSARVSESSVLTTNDNNAKRWGIDIGELDVRDRGLKAVRPIVRIQDDSGGTTSRDETHFLPMPSASRRTNEDSSTEFLEEMSLQESHSIPLVRTDGFKKDRT